FKVTLQQQQLQLRQLHIQYQTDFANLNYLCGIYDTSAALLAAPDISVNTLPDLATSAFFRKYIIDSLKLQNSISILNYSYHPKLNAFVNTGWYSSLLFESYKNFGVGFGLNLAVPIYDGNQRRLQYRKIKLLEDTRANYEDFFTRQYNQQIAQLTQQLKATESLISEIEAQVKYTETLIQVDEKQMQTGDTRIADYVIAINNYMATKNLLTQNSINRMQIITQINYWNR
ncbi:MAG: TolC family protein, partial [Flavipsychrobacter sp.]